MRHYTKSEIKPELRGDIDLAVIDTFGLISIYYINSTKNSIGIEQHKRMLVRYDGINATAFSDCRAIMSDITKLTSETVIPKLESLNNLLINPKK